MLGMPHVRSTCMGPLLWVRVAPKKGFLKGLHSNFAVKLFLVYPKSYQIVKENEFQF
jgi:hypothetical protein